ncbi:MAG: hypothetical protein U0T36_02305 [Saprospiraceae bacterium]
MRLLFYVFSILIIVSNSNAQEFSDASSLLPQSGTFYSWMQKGAADMDGDGYDDIVRANTSGQFS